MDIDTLEPVELNGTTQWIRVRGTDRTNPVLLLMQQGPGLPIINEALGFGLESDFTAVYWDQRGTGLSARVGDITVANMVDDTVALLELLRDRFGGPTYVAGFSFGATFAAYAAARRPDLVAALVATGMDIDVPAAEPATYRFVLDTARGRGHRRAIRQLERIGPPPHLTVRRFRTRARWAANFGGVTAGVTFGGLLRTMLASLVRSPDYSPAAVVRAVRGMTASQAALLPQLASTDLVHDVPRLDVPVFFAQGRLDRVAPGEATQRYFDALVAPRKELVWFENSAHTPQYDEPGRFRELLVAAKTA